MWEVILKLKPLKCESPENILFLSPREGMAKKKIFQAGILPQYYAETCISAHKFQQYIFSTGFPQNCGGKGDSPVPTITSFTPVPSPNRVDGHRMCRRVDSSTRTTLQQFPLQVLTEPNIA